jgi:hypothetical protein
MREKNKQINKRERERGVGVVFQLLHPDTGIQVGLVLCWGYVPQKVAQIKQNSHLKQCISWGLQN